MLLGAENISELDFFEIAETWRNAPPVFVRHISPVEQWFPLMGGIIGSDMGSNIGSDTDTGIEPDSHHPDITGLTEMVLSEFGDLLDPDFTFSVQSRVLADLPYKPFDINRALSTALHQATGAVLDVRSPQQVISVVCADYAYVGFSLALHNLSNWAGGMHRFARTGNQVSRSAFKLMEALTVFEIALPERGTALDLGAVPGGWTQVLRQQSQYVTAVDPGQLNPRVREDAAVRHKHMTAEQYLRENTTEPEYYDLIVNDMRMDATDSASLMVDYAQYLYRHGLILMTIKLPSNQPEIQKADMDDALAILRETYDIVRVKQLFHNRHEVMVYGRVMSDE